MYLLPVTLQLGLNRRHVALVVFKRKIKFLNIFRVQSNMFSKKRKVDNENRKFLAE